MHSNLDSIDRDLSMPFTARTTRAPAAHRGAAEQFSRDRRPREVADESEKLFARDVVCVSRAFREDRSYLSCFFFSLFRERFCRLKREFSTFKGSFLNADEIIAEKDAGLSRRLVVNNARRHTAAEKLPRVLFAG